MIENACWPHVGFWSRRPRRCSPRLRWPCCLGSSPSRRAQPAGTMGCNGGPRRGERVVPVLFTQKVGIGSRTSCNGEILGLGANKCPCPLGMPVPNGDLWALQMHGGLPHGRPGRRPRGRPHSTGCPQSDTGSGCDAAAPNRRRRPLRPCLSCTPEPSLCRSGPGLLRNPAILARRMRVALPRWASIDTSLSAGSDRVGSTPSPPDPVASQPEACWCPPGSRLSP